MSYYSAGMKNSFITFYRSATCLTTLVLCIASAAQGRMTIGEFLAESGKNAEMDTLRGIVHEMIDEKKYIFSISDESGEATVQMDRKDKEAFKEFCSMDIRIGDTLMVCGLRNARSLRKKSLPSMVSARMLSVAEASGREDQPFLVQILDVYPTFMGKAPNTFASWVNKSLVYPRASRTLGSEGKVLLRFAIDVDGKVVDIDVLESSGDFLLDEEACRVVESSPEWTPGYFHGKPVKVSYTFPVYFVLKSASNTRE